MWLLGIVLLTGLELASNVSQSGSAEPDQPTAAERADRDAKASIAEKPATEKKPSQPPRKKPTSVPSGKTSRTTTRPTFSDGPRVKTAEEMKASGSPFLAPTGKSDPLERRYGSDSNATTNGLPWHQSSFFGLQGTGQFFVYVVDCSESMIDEDRFARATIELRRSVLALRQPQKFEVILYNKYSIPMPGGPRPRSADLTEKSHLLNWLRVIEPVGGTDPRLALRQALTLRPDAVFLLSDGVFPDDTVEDVIKLNAHTIPIHCVDLSGGLGGNQLERIARTSGGRYASRPVNTLRAKP